MIRINDKIVFNITNKKLVTLALAGLSLYMVSKGNVPAFRDILLLSVGALAGVASDEVDKK